MNEAPVSKNEFSRLFWGAWIISHSQNFFKTRLTSRRNKKAFKSLNLKELPTEIVCAVSPAQNIPSGFLVKDLNTKRQISAESCKMKIRLTQSINEQIVLSLVYISRETNEWSK